MPKWQCPENARDRGGKKESCGVFRRKSRALMKVSIAADERRELARVPLKNKNTGDLVLPNYRNRKRTSPLAKRRLRTDVVNQHMSNDIRAQPPTRGMEREKDIMARDTEFAQQTSERAMQAAAFGFTWSREFAEESFNQGKRTLDALMRVARKMADDFESQCSAIREQTTDVTEKTLSNTMEYGQKLARVKEPQEFAQCQSEFLARQAQTLADQTKEFGQRMQKAAQAFASNASHAMAEASRRTEDTVSTITSRAADQTSKRQRAEA
jgi:hypothetical protein